MSTELELKEKTHAMLKKDFIQKGEPLWFYHPSDRFHSGIPDYIGCYGGIFWVAEQKIPKGKPNKIQLAVMKKMEASGAETLFKFSKPDELKEFLLAIKNKYGRRWAHRVLEIDGV